MRTAREELLSDIMMILSNAYGDGSLTAEQEYKENLHNAEEIVSMFWKHVEPFVIDSNGRLFFDYGMIKHALNQ